ncbi:MAG: M15 family metallopeptidase [Oscillospiraceae bacterium]
MPRRRKRRLKTGKIIAALIIVVLLIVGIVWIVKALFSPPTPNENSSSSPSETLSDSSDAEGSNASDPASANKSYKTVSMSKDDIHNGDLILVNYQAAFVSEEPTDLVTVASAKTKDYLSKNDTLQVRQTIMKPFNQMMKAFVKETKLKDVMVLSGHKSLSYQETLYQNDLKKTGKTESEEVAKPGQSEHHTGLAIDLATYNKTDGSKFLDGNGKYGWINENCYKYGFVTRFPESKKDITKIIYEPWHYRFVGTVHAALMQENNFCLEEYLEFLKKYPVDGEHLKTIDNGKNYEIYYVPVAADAISVDVSVPTEKPYTISGNNMDGLIVTAEV